MARNDFLTEQQFNDKYPELVKRYRDEMIKRGIDPAMFYFTQASEADYQGDRHVEAFYSNEFDENLSVYVEVNLDADEFNLSVNSD